MTGKRSKDVGQRIMKQIRDLLFDKYSPYDGFTGRHICMIILGSDRIEDFQYIQRLIGSMRRYELKKIQINEGNYLPAFFPAAKKINEKYWRYFNAVKEPHFSDVMKIYFQRAEGFEQVARTMGMVNNNQNE